MEELNDDLNLRSEEVREILGTPPRWLVRWGTISAFVGLVTLGWVGYWVKYPDIVSTRVTVSSVDPVRRLLTDETVYIEEILVKSEDTVRAGEAIVVFRNPANYNHVFALSDVLAKANQTKTDSALLNMSVPKDYILGDLQEFVYNFLEKQRQYQLHLSGQLDNMNVSQLRDRVSREQSSIKDARQERENIQARLDLARENLTREENLLSQRLTTPERIRPLRDEVLNYERLLQRIETESKSKESDIKLIRRELDGYRSGAKENRLTFSRALQESFQALKRATDAWIKKYTLISPINGTVILDKSLRPYQYFDRNKEVAIVLPLFTDEIVGRSNLNLSGSGKVNPGQDVIVKFDNYPFQEFGAVNAKVTWKGKVPTQGGGIPVEINFPGGLITSTNHTLEFTQDIQGTAEIITSEKSLLVWIFERMR